ncbi:MAG TPA: DUF6350 family protein, partial [Jatrophihabitans sp.]|nr:DUF6350 family protein [Jatrophihabitans sp.]
LVVHHGRVEALSAQVGGGWSGAPVLLLGVLAAPNAVIAAAGYLAGPGFALGSGTHVSLFTTAHGVLPAFPVLGATPTGHGAPWPVLAVAVASPVLAGGTTAALAMRVPGWPARLRTVWIAGALAGLAGIVAAWQGGGAIGTERLRTIGASPWQFGLALGVELAVVATVGLGAAALAIVLRGWWTRRRRDRDEPGRLQGALQVVRTAVAAVSPGGTEAGDATHDDDAADPDDEPAAREADPDEVTVKIPPGELTG